MVDASNWQVLVVEDEFDSAELIAKILRFHGAEVYLARNGAECLEKLKAGGNFEEPALWIR